MTVASDWVTAGAAWRASLTPLGAESAADQERHSRVFNHSGMTPAAAARAYNRVLAQRELTAQAVHAESSVAKFVNDQGPSSDFPGPSVQVADPIAEEPKIDYGGHNYAGGMPPEKKPEQPGVTTPKPGAATPPPPASQPAATQSVPSTTTPPPPPAIELGEVPASSSPIPVPPSGSENSGPLFDRPDISGKKEGESWTEVRDGFTHTYTIPVGNGNKSVDQEVTRDGVLIGSSRLAYGENGGVQQWVDIVGSASLYAEQESAGANQYTQMFNAGTSTSGAPDSSFGTLPDLKTTFTLVDNGVPVGSLETISTEPGLIHTAYVNKDGDVSTWRTNETEHGGLVTNPIKYQDHSGRGWYSGNPSGGPLWEISPKLDGSSLYTNTETTNSGTHIRVWDPSNESKTDKFYSKSGVGGYLVSTNADGITVDGDDGSRAKYDLLGRLIESREPTMKDPKPDLRSNYERFTSFSRDVATGFELAYDEMKSGIAALAGQQERGVDGWANRLVLSVMDGSLKDAWLGLATSGVGIGAGLAFTAIDIAAISMGQGSWEQLGRDVLGTGNELSIFAIGADWTRAGKDPGETVGRALFGSMFLLGPKGINTATGKLPPPSAVNTAIKTAANTALQNTSVGLGNIGRTFGQPALAEAGRHGFSGMARTPGPTSFATNAGNTPSGSRPSSTPNIAPSTSGTTANRGSNAAPLLPAEIANAGARHSVEQSNVGSRDRGVLPDTSSTTNSRRPQSADSQLSSRSGDSWELHVGVSVDQLRSMPPERVHEYQVRRANIDSKYRAEFYNTLGHRKNVRATDDTGLVPPQLKENPSGSWVAASEVPEAARPLYKEEDVLGAADELSASQRALMNGLALDRAQSIQAVPRSKDIPGYSTAQGRMSKAAERYGEGALRRHAMPVNFPRAVELELHGPSNGNDQFDQVWVDPGPEFYIVGEAKSQERTGLNSRALPSGLRVSQGTVEYFLDILRMMEDRGPMWSSEAWLAAELRKALNEERLWYGVVYGRPGTGGLHDGYKMRRFDI
ncbi:hypothetical protein [Nocardia sp. NPDC060259]|uniref:hypothetical protein n=1 Tax=Nocardia sp. NPDC060259 TaxID=3347088 RepID=UPI00365B18D6